MITSEPRLSVIIPAHNAAATLGRAIDSVVTQTRPVFEIIVVDDGSVDATAEVAAAYGPAVTILQQKNSQAAAARNTGISAAKGDWIAFLDADDVWLPIKVEQQCNTITKYPTVGVLAGGYQTESPQTGRRESSIRHASRWCDQVIKPGSVDAFFLGTRLWTGTVMVRRDVLGDDRFQPGLEPAEDRDLWIRLVGRSSVYISSADLSVCVLEPGSLSRTNLQRDCLAMLRVIDRHRSHLGFVKRLAWRSYVFYRWAAMENRPTVALRRVTQSFGLWPVPLVHMPTMQTLGRLKLTVRILQRLALRTGRSEQGVSI